MVTRGEYAPERGDLVWMEFDPQAGHEQAGRRPAVAISPGLYNRKRGLAIFCPVTTRAKGYPFEVLIPEGTGLEGVVLADQLKSLDWRARRAKRAGRLGQTAMEEVLAKILALVGN